MAWYRAGTVSVTNGSATVTGAGTDFVSNASIGEAFLGPDGRAYEITQVVSATQIVLSMPYQGAGAGGQGYAVLPTQSFVRDLALGAAALLNSFATVRDGVGQGLFPDGSTATPGVRFANDQDTGWRRVAENALAIVAGGVDRVTVDSQGNVGIGTPNPVQAVDISRPGLAAVRLSGGGHTVELAASSTGYAALGTIGATFLDLVTNSIARGRITADGHLLFGTTNFSGLGTCHRIVRSAAQGAGLITFDNGSSTSLYVTAAGAEGFNAAASAIKVGRNTDTGRSVTSGGTINASGADYAEYMVKAAGCGTIAKGDVCGVDRDGKLTKTWADAISFVIKSTDPSLVGGDTWDAEVGPKPEEPGTAPAEPSPPAPPAEDADDATIAAWREAMAAYPAQVASYQAARVEWQKATDAYAKALPVWEGAHEKARQCVDRIAFCGQVPANVTGAFEVGDYIIAAASGAGIKAVALKADDMTLPQYMRRIGKVWAIRDGRAWIDVQHG